VPVPVPVAAHFAAPQFRSADAAPRVAAALQRHQPGPGWLELEPTESMLPSRADLARQTLETLRGLGVRLGIDDFGAGFASLSSLRRFQVQPLTIDRSCFAGIESDAGAAEIVGLRVPARTSASTPAQGR
jgi:EAL domain-containing protein (putative c-di-GMP-specific phosphodiesterase class I)